MDETKLQDLFTQFENASFDCGEHPGDPNEDYQKLLGRLQMAREALTKYILAQDESLRDELERLRDIVGKEDVKSIDLILNNELHES